MLAAIAAAGTVVVLCVLVVQDILHPERDAVRSTYPDDPDGRRPRRCPRRPLADRSVAEPPPRTRASPHPPDADPSPDARVQRPRPSGAGEPTAQDQA